MITLVESRCSRCGLCLKVCHELCIKISEIGLEIDYALCSTCTQCIAVCPNKALNWNGIEPSSFNELLFPKEEMIEELLKERRTIRFFKDTPLDMDVVNEIVNYGIYAPTNNYDLRAIVIDNQKVILELDQLVMNFVKRIYNLIFRSEIIFNLLRSITPIASPKDKVKIEKTIKEGTNYQSIPSTIIFLVGEKRIPLSVESAQYPLYNMALMAQAKGIGSRLKGTGQIVLDRNGRARRILGLNRGEHILGMLEMGIPDIRFRNKVEGKVFPVKWIH